MPVWQAAIMLNLALALGLGVGYATWGRKADALDRDLDGAQARLERLERERRACLGGARSGEQQWDGRGVVRAVYPQIVVITHEEIQGLLSRRTTGFRVAVAAASPVIVVGDAVRFSLRGTGPDDAALVAIEPW
jgi:Copper binding periplasmic protein CusF